jgi:hypothetical protein
MRFFSVMLLFPILSAGQMKDSYKNFLPKDVEARPFLDSTNNYIPDSLEQSVFDYIKSKNIDPKKCFINKNIFEDKKEGTVEIRLEDIDDLKNERDFDAATKKKQKIMSYSRGFSRTLVINLKTKRVVSVMYDQ